MDRDSFPTNPFADDRPLWNALFGLLACPAILASYDVGLYRALRESPRTRDEIARELGLERRPLDTLVAVNVAAGLLVLDRATGQCQLTPLASEYLLEGSDASLGGFFDLVKGVFGFYSPDHVLRAVRTNAPVLPGGDVFDTNEAAPERARAFIRSIRGMSVAASRAWPEAIDLSGARTFVDVGGGAAMHSISAARRWPQLTATIFDLQASCDVAREYIAAAGLSERVGVHVGDMFRDPLPRADVHFYSMIFHDWSRDACLELARKSFAAINPGGRIAVFEMLMDDDKAGPLAVASLSVSMLLGTHGEQYSGAEIGEMLRAAGFVDVEVKRPLGYWGLVTARRP